MLDRLRHAAKKIWPAIVLCAALPSSSPAVSQLFPVKPGTGALRAQSMKARLAGMSAGRRDLARYLRFDPGVITSPGPTRRLHPKKAVIRESNKAASGRITAEEALLPLRSLKTGVPSATAFAEALLRLGYGVPRRYFKLANDGTVPLGKAVDELLRALRAARGRASASKTHIAIENILRKAQETHYLLSELSSALFRAESLVVEIQAPIEDLSSSRGMTGRLALCLLHISRSARGNLKAAADGMRQNREDLKRAFSAVKKSMAELDKAIEQTWTKAADSVLLADAPGSLKTTYRLLKRARKTLDECNERAPALEELFRVNYRSVTASINALAQGTRGLSRDSRAADQLEKHSSLSYGRLRGMLGKLETEHGRLNVWNEVIEGKRTAKLDLPFPPVFVLLERAPLRTDPPGKDPITWDPDLSLDGDELFSRPDEPGAPDTPAFCRNEQKAPAANEETNSIEDDLQLLEEIEADYRQEDQLLASPATAALINARYMQD